MKELIASFISGSVSGESKSSKLVNVLINKMTDKQLEVWVQKLEELQGTNITANVLDQKLSEVFNMHTEFFAMNETVDDVYPLIFTDKRQLNVNENNIEDIKVIYQNGLLYYSSDKMLELLGYKVSEGPNGYYVDSELRSFRFPENFDFYVFNQRRYDTLSSPIINIMDERFIEESWLQRLFLVEIEKTNDEITISPIYSIQ